MMAKKAAGGIATLLKVGRRVIVSSLRNPGNELPSKVTQVSLNTFQLHSTRPTGGWPFQEGELIRVICIEEGVLYCWDGEVETFSDVEKRDVTFSITSVGVTLVKRKSPRIKVSLPFSFIIFEAVKPEIIGDELVKGRTRDVSVNGLSFKTDLSLELGDQLQLTLQIPSKPVNAIGWVVRCEPDEGESLVAVEFLQPEEQEQKQLLKFLAQVEEKLD